MNVFAVIFLGIASNKKWAHFVRFFIEVTLFFFNRHQKIPALYCNSVKLWNQLVKKKHLSPKYDLKIQKPEKSDNFYFVNCKYL